MTDAADKRPIAVIVNPDAGRAGAAVIEPLRAALGGRGRVWPASSLGELEAAATGALADGAGMVAVCGGDGTLGRVVTAVSRCCRDGELPSFAPLGGGTLNTTARALGLTKRRQPVEVLRRCLLGAGRRFEQGTMRTGDGRVGFMIGAVVPARFLRLYEDGGQAGVMRALRVLSGLASSAVTGGETSRQLFSPVVATLSIDGGVGTEMDLTVLYASVIKEIGLGFQPTPRAGERPGHFQILASSAAPVDLVRALPQIRAGLELEGDAWMNELAASADVAFREPALYMVDGDVEGEVDELRIHSGPVIEMFVASAS